MTARLHHETRAAMLALVAGLPAVVVSIALLFMDGHSTKVQWTLMVLILFAWGAGAWTLHEHVMRPLQSLTNLLTALREGDFSIRGRGANRDDVLGAAILEANTLADTLQNQQLRVLEAAALLRKVMDEIDVAIMVFDGLGVVKLANPAAERLMRIPVERLTGQTALALQLSPLLEGDAQRTVTAPLPAGSGPWEVRRREIRQGGLPHILLMVSNIQRALREEERAVWQRLVRVLGHEINNSLTPIQSIAQSALALFKRESPPADRDVDVMDGLNVIARRAESLVRFMEAYSRLARLPPPTPRSVDLRELMQRVVGLETRVPVNLGDVAPLRVHADGDQLEQALINLVKNAADASLEKMTPVQVDVTHSGNEVVITILDQGPGVGETRNLFVPFFTTKPGGSGIGLVLARQIAEAHGGTVTLVNREDGTGCVASLTLMTRLCQ